MRERARAVVIGGGVGGCSILYWLTRLGMGRRRARRAGRPHERLDLPLGRARRPAALVALADPDDDGLRRPLPDADRRGRARDRLARGRLVAARVVRGAAGGDHPPGRVGEDVRPPPRADLARGGAGAVPADVPRRRGRRRVPAHRRLHRPEPADVRARRGCAPAWGGGQHLHAGDRDPHAPGSRPGSRDGQGRDRDGGGRQRRRHVRARDRRARGRRRPDRADGARVPRAEAERPAARHAHDARPLAPRLLPPGVGWADHGRLRAGLRAVVARRDPGGLQRQAARGGLAALRGADAERDRARARTRGDGRREAHQRPRGVHARRRVHPRAVGPPRLLGRGRLLRARPRRGGRDGKARRGVDRRGHAVARRLAHGLATVRCRVPVAAAHRRPDEGDLRDLLRREVPRARARGGPAAADVGRVSTARRARRRVRREVRLGARELVRAERGRRRRGASPPGLGREALVARDRRGARGVPRGRSALRRVVLREDRGVGGRRRRVPRGALREPGRA